MKGSISNGDGSYSFIVLYQGLDQCPKDVDLADIVNQSEQAPLYIHFQFGTKGETVHALLHTDVGKDRLDDP